MYALEKVPLMKRFLHSNQQQKKRFENLESILSMIAKFVASFKLSLYLIQGCSRYLKKKLFKKQTIGSETNKNDNMHNFSKSKR